MKRGHPVNIFNFSFLDVFACAVGVMIFVMMVLVLQSVFSVTPDARQQFDEANRLESRLEELEEQAAEFEEDAIQMRDTETKLELAEKRIQEAKEVLAKVVPRVQNISESLDRVRQLQESVEKAKRSAAATGAQLRSGGFVEQTMTIRKPARRKTDKTNNLYLIFNGDQIRMIRRINRPPGFSSPHYRVRDNDDEVECIAYGGESIRSFLSGASEVREGLNALSPLRDYVECLVEPNQQAFDDFVQVREVIYQMDIDVGCRFTLDTDNVTFGSFGTNTQVQ